MSLEQSLLAIAEALQAVAASNVKAAEIYAGSRTHVTEAATKGVSEAAPAGVKEDAPAEEPVQEKKSTTKRTTTKKQVDTPADPDVEKEPVKEEEVEKPRKEIDVESLKDQIRAVFTKLSEKGSDKPMAVLKSEGHTRLSLVDPEDLPALLLAAKDALKALTADYE